MGIIIHHSPLPHEARHHSGALCVISQCCTLQLRVPLQLTASHSSSLYHSGVGVPPITACLTAVTTATDVLAWIIVSADGSNYYQCYIIGKDEFTFARDLRLTDSCYS